VGFAGAVELLALVRRVVTEEVLAVAVVGIAAVFGLAALREGGVRGGAALVDAGAARRGAVAVAGALIGTGAGGDDALAAAAAGEVAAVAGDGAFVAGIRHGLALRNEDVALGVAVGIGR